MATVFFVILKLVLDVPMDDVGWGWIFLALFLDYLDSRD